MSRSCHWVSRARELSGRSRREHRRSTANGWERFLARGRVAIVTGASRGIGATTAEVFADRGATVILAARDEQALVGVADAIEAGGGRALVVPTDVNDAPSVERLVERAGSAASTPR